MSRKGKGRAFRGWKERALGVLAALAVLASCYVLGGFWLYYQLDSRYGRVREGMSIVEVRQLTQGTLVESDVTVGQIVEEGYAVSHLSLPNEKTKGAKKYAYRIFKSLYFYVIYGEDDKVQLSVPAYE